MSAVIEHTSPDQFLAQAIQQNASVDTIERMLALKERYEASQAKQAYEQAMHKFQQIKPELRRSKEVSYGAKVAYRFCPLSEIEAALKEPLKECGLTYRFEHVREGSAQGVRCVVTHVQGHSEGTELYAPPDDSGNKNAIQGIGSTSTYLMRYTLIAAFALTTADDDNDGETTGDLPLMRLVNHNKAVRENWQFVSAMKDALACEDYHAAAELWFDCPEFLKQQLWLAPTNGGIFTTEERTMLKSNQAHAAKNEIAEARGLKHD